MVRPRLTDLEIKFMVECLKHTLSFLELKEREFKELKLKVHRLLGELTFNSTVWKELKEAREELEQMRGLPSQLVRYRLACNSLIRRFQGLLKGRKLHTPCWTLKFMEET